MRLQELPGAIEWGNVNMFREEEDWNTGSIRENANSQFEFLFGNDAMKDWQDAERAMVEQRRMLDGEYITSLTIADDSSKKYISENVSDEEVKDMKVLGKTRDELQNVKREINQHAKEPMDTLVGLMKENRVLGMDSSIFNNGLDAKEVFRKLKDAGATTVVLQESNKELVSEAKRAGLKVYVCERDKETGSPGKGLADGVEYALDNKENKVIMISDRYQQSLKDGSSSIGQTAAEILKDKHKVATVLGERAGGHDGYLKHFRPAGTLSTDLKKPIALSIESAKTLRELNDSFIKNNDWTVPYKNWDYLIILPPKKM
jgi:hypothetical protein